jgi:hypothetical protein
MPTAKLKCPVVIEVTPAARRRRRTINRDAPEEKEKISFCQLVSGTCRQAAISFCQPFSGTCRQAAT